MEEIALATSQREALFLRQLRDQSDAIVETVSSRSLTTSEEAFRAILALERHRAERSRNPFVLMLLEGGNADGSGRSVLSQVIRALEPCTRETDVVGWYQQGSILGVIFTELGKGGDALAIEILRAKVTSSLREQIGPEAARKISISAHLFPESWDLNRDHWVADFKLYPELDSSALQKKVSLVIKRIIDITGSVALLLLISPLLAAISIIIKLTSDGPVLF